MHWLAVTSYGLATAIYAVAAVTMSVVRPVGPSAAFTTAVGASAIWAAGHALLLGSAAPAVVFVGLDVLHAYAWTAFVVACSAAPRGLRTALKAAAAFAAAAAVAAALLAGAAGPRGAGFGLAALCVTGLAAVVAMLRFAPLPRHAGLALLAIASAGVLASDLVNHLHALASGGPSWLAHCRGLVDGFFVPLALLGMRRARAWEPNLVIRQIAYFAAGLAGIVVYMAVMGAVAYAVHVSGGQWSNVLQALFLLGTVGIVLLLRFSSQLRAELRVWLLKHFFRHKYDYRREWLLLTQRLARAGDLRMLAANSLEALAQIVGSRSGDLWIARDPRRYEWMVSLDPSQPPKQPYDLNHPIVLFMAAHGWVIDAAEYARKPERYGRFFGEPGDGVLPPDHLIVPLDCQGYLQGFAMLAKPTEVGELNFEDHDILKTAGRQVGVTLAQEIALERLSETRQFEAMNKLSTFLMHDLKNIVTQQELVVANAQRFRHRPEFIDDAVATIRSGIERMKRVLDQLHSGAKYSELRGRVDLTKILMEVRSHCADREPVPSIDVGQTAAWVNMDHDDITSAVTHVIRNAQDATPPDGRIRVALAAAKGRWIITVEDSGRGMDAEFLRDRLFRPFDSTKGAKGMGIGAYQVREIVRAAGGDVDVASEPGRGTVFRLVLPAAEAAVEPFRDAGRASRAAAESENRERASSARP